MAKTTDQRQADPGIVDLRPIYQQKLEQISSQGVDEALLDFGPVKNREGGLARKLVAGAKWLFLGASQRTDRPPVLVTGHRIRR